jgi:hypothetical protein
MSIINYEQLEIVGFEGTPLVECEMVLPVGRVVVDDVFFKFEGRHSNAFRAEGIDRNKIVFYSREEIQSLVEEGRVTILRETFAAMRTPLIAYVYDEFLQAAESRLPDSIPNQRLSEHIRVLCGRADALEHLLDEWATRLMDNSTAMLEGYFHEAQLEFSVEAERLTDLALCAATDVTLRARIYLRAGVAIMLSAQPERLDNLYEFSIRQQFPDWSWTSFKERLKRMVEILRMKAEFKLREISPPDNVPDLLPVSCVVSQIENPAERYAESQSMAESYRYTQLIPEEWIDRVAMMLVASPRIRLDNDIRKALQGDTLFYYLGDALFVKSEHQRLNEPDKAPLLSAETYLKAAREFVQRNLDPGELASIALRKYVREPMVV